MRAIIVAVDYADFLAVTLPYNRHHFADVMIVTTSTDTAVHEVAKRNNANVFATDAFYTGGAAFNKWIALEQGLDAFGREGWLCLLDADILWPKRLPRFEIMAGNLYTPHRRMFTDLTRPIPSESEWSTYPRHHVQHEFSGYCQIFHGSDPCLGAPPWYQVNWRHAGGADTFFQEKWLPTNKIRPPFDVLHIGADGINWCGRATPYLDGSIHPAAERRLQQLRRFQRGRQRTGRFDGEKMRGDL